MNTTVISKLFLILSILLWGSNVAWADTTIGATNKGWTEEGAYTTTAYTIEPNKTFSIQFVLNSTKGVDNWDSWQTVLRSESTWGSGTEYLAMRGDAYGVRNADWVYDNQNNTGNGSWFIVNVNTYNWDTYKADIVGATVKLTIKRIGTELFLMEDVTTTSSVTYKHYFGMECGDGTQNVYAFLAANNCQLTISDATSVTDSESYIGTQIGNGGSFLSGNHEDFTLGANETLTLHFKNYSSKYSNLSNWFVEIVNNGKYLDLRADRWGWDYNANNEYWAETNFTTLTSTGGDYWSNYIEEMDGADVVLTIVRSSNNISISAVQAATNSVVRTVTYSLTHDDFATNDITVKLSSWFSHLDLLPVTATISSYGWATFSSDYALDFSNATEGLTAYMITGRDGTTVTKSEVTGTVPAGTGLLLKGDAGSYNIPIVGSSSTDVSTNLMKPGTGGAISAEDGYTRYVLGVNNNNTTEDSSDDYAEFQKIVSTPATVAVGKAYLEFDGTVSAPSLKFDFDISTPTAIDVVETAAKVQQNNEVYNLAGQRVAQPKKGLYIVNGKKVVK